MTTNKHHHALIAGALLALVASTTQAVAPATAPGATAARPVTPALKPITSAASAPKPVAKPVLLPEMTARQIADRNAQARGGLQAWQKVGSLSLAGKLDAGRTRKDGEGVQTTTSKLEQRLARARMRKNLATTGSISDSKPIQLPFVLELKRPDKSRLEVPFAGTTSVQAFDGTQGWKRRPYTGHDEVEPFNPVELHLAQGQQPLDGMLINYAAKGTTVERDGNELVEGRPAYKLKLTLKNGDVRHLWVDAQTFLEVRVDAEPRHWNGKTYPVLTYFRDYRPEQGLQVAHRLETVVQGMHGSESIYIEKVAINPPIADDRFARPQ